MKPYSKIPFSDALAACLALVVTMPFVAKPDQDWVMRIALLLAGLCGMSIGWRLTWGQRPFLKVMVIPSITLLVLMIVTILWDFMQS